MAQKDFACKVSRLLPCVSGPGLNVSLLARGVVHHNLVTSQRLCSSKTRQSAPAVQALTHGRCFSSIMRYGARLLMSSKQALKGVLAQDDLEAAEDVIEQAGAAVRLNGQSAGMASVLTSSLYTASGAVLKDCKQLTTQAMQRWGPYIGCTALAYGVGDQ